jgi:hypothetical protein
MCSIGEKKHLRLGGKLDPINIILEKESHGKRNPLISELENTRII